MKGKNFNAAEKHFMEKELRLKKEIANLKSENSELRKLLFSKDNEVNSLINKNSELEEWIERLLTYSELNREDIRQVCLDDKRKSANINMVLDLVSKFI